MKPRDFMDQIANLIADGRDEDALALAEQWGSRVAPKLSREEFFRLLGMMEGAQLVVDLAQAERANQQSVEASVPGRAQPG
jgi:hypothetical protein